VVAECSQLATVAELRRKEEIRSSFPIVAGVVIAMVWLLSAVAANWLIAHYISH
jgi:hypothetical protein